MVYGSRPIYPVVSVSCPFRVREATKVAFILTCPFLGERERRGGGGEGGRGKERGREREACFSRIKTNMAMHCPQVCKASKAPTPYTLLGSQVYKASKAPHNYM